MAVQDFIDRIKNYLPTDKFLTIFEENLVEGAIQGLEDNKLEKGAYTGTAEDLNTKIGNIKTYDTIADLQADTTLLEGDMIQVLGYYTKNDSGGHYRTIVLNVDADSSAIALSNGTHSAILTTFNVIRTKEINAKWLGAKGDYNITTETVTDDTIAIQKCIDYLDNGGIIKLDGNFAVTELSITNTLGSSEYGYNNITFQGNGRESTNLIGIGSVGSWMITAKYAVGLYFGSIGIKDMTIRGKNNTYDVNGVSTEFVLGNHFENVGFKYLDTCHRGINNYQSCYNNIRLWEYNIGFRGLSTAEGVITGQIPAQVPFAECIFTGVYFYGGNTANPKTSTAVSVEGKGLNACTFNTCTFAGNSSGTIDFSEGIGFTFNSCRFERMGADQDWLILGDDNRMYKSHFYTDSTNCWWTPTNPDSDSWAIKIVGSNNIIDGISPELPRQVIKFEEGSSNNEARWYPPQDSWSGGTWFYNPIYDLGENNLVKIGDLDEISSRLYPKTKRDVNNLLVGSNDQTCFTNVQATKTHTPTDLDRGPYNNESVYSYESPTSDRLIYSPLAGLYSGTWYTFSMWVATDNISTLDNFQIFLGEDIFVAENFAKINLESSQKWTRVFKSFKSTGATMNVGFRLPSGTTGKLYVSQPQLTTCGTESQDVFVGAYVPAVNAETTVNFPNLHTSYNLINKTSSRVLGDLYTNTTKKDIEVYVVSYSLTADAIIKVNLDGVTVTQEQIVADRYACVSFVVKPGQNYQVIWSAGGVLTTWYEKI